MQISLQWAATGQRFMSEVVTLTEDHAQATHSYSEAGGQALWIVERQLAWPLVSS